MLLSSHSVATSKKTVWLSSLCVALMAYLFLVIFQPFGTYNYTHQSKYLLLLPYAAHTFVIFFLGDMAAGRLLKRWSWSKECLKLVILLVVCALLNYVYSIYFINHTPFQLQTLAYMGLFTFALGIPVGIIYLMGRYIWMPYRQAPVDAGSQEPNMQAEHHLLINPDAGECIDLACPDFFYARSEGNYSTLCYLHEGKIQTRLVRISLKKLEAQICGGTITRCHRSYIVNTVRVKDKKGNAQGYKLKFDCLPDVVPVSRGYIDRLRVLIE